MLYWLLSQFSLHRSCVIGLAIEINIYAFMACIGIRNYLMLVLLNLMLIHFDFLSRVSFYHSFLLSFSCDFSC